VLSGTYEELARRVEESGARVLDPDRMRLLRHDHAVFDPSMQLEWGECWDLRGGGPIWIPLTFLLLGYDGPQCSTWYQSSNGLASGNCLEEAICHGLAELIERDAYTMAMVRVGLLPRVRALVTSVLEDRAAAEPGRPAEDNAAEAAPFIQLETLPVALLRVVRDLEAAGAELVLRYLPSDTGVPAFAALLRSPFGIERLDTGGFGAHLNAAIAAGRAISEAVQSRATLIQGSREDIPRIFGEGTSHIGRRAAPLLWQGDRSAAINFADIPSRNNSGLLDDIDGMVEGLARAGIEEVYAADLSRAGVPAAVAKVIAPDLEVWFVSDFDSDNCNLGPRARRLLTVEGDTGIAA
jgi:ribosomal protein S12 methylthiotransferase accessory factor